MEIVDTYKKINNFSNTKIINKYPKEYFPKLSSKDYNLGYIVRYFTKLKSNKYSIITEVDFDEYTKFSEDNLNEKSLFDTISLRWKITGKREDVIQSNTKIVEAKELLMPGISLKLGNRLQFWKNL